MKTSPQKIGLLAVLLLTQLAPAADFTWTNATSGNWNSAANWSPNAVPGAADNANFGTLASAYTATLNTNQSITNLTLNASNATLNQTAGRLTASGAVNVTNGIYNLATVGSNTGLTLSGNSATLAVNGGVFNLNTGTLTAPNSVAVSSGTLNLNGGTLTLNGSLTTGTAGTVNWAESTLTGVGTLAGTITVTGGGTVTGTTLTNGGTINWQGGSVLATANAALTNAGLINFQADSSSGFPTLRNTSPTNPGTLINTGTLRKSGGSVTSTDIGWAVTLSGGSTLDGQVGTLRLTGGGTLSGGTTTVSGNGSVQLAGGTFTVPNNTTFTAGSSGGATLQLAGGTLKAGDLGGTLAGTVTVTGGGGVTGTTLINSGTINWQSGSVSATSSAALTNSGLINFQADGTAFTNSSLSNPGTLINSGTLRKSGGTATATTINWKAEFGNGGLVQANVGALNFAGGGNLGVAGTSSTTTVSGGGTANLTAGTFTVPSQATFTAAGNGFNWAGSTLTAEGLGGTLAGTITVTNGGRVAGSSLRTAGTINWQAGVITGSGGNVALTNTGLMDLQADGTAFGSIGAGILFNEGTLRKSGGTGATSIAWAITNTGMVTVGRNLTLSGTINSNANGVVTGSAAATAADVSTYGGPLNFNTGSTLAPGTTTGTGAILVSNDLTFSSGSTLHLNLNGTTAVTGFDRVRVAAGVGNTTSLGGATLALDFGGTFTPTATDQLFILVNEHNTAISGTFAGLAQNAIGTLGGWNFQISYLGNFGTDSLTGGNDIVLYNFTPVPEPASVLALAAGALGVTGWVRRRRTRNRPTADPVV